MKNLKYLLLLSALVMIGFGCSDDDLDGDALTDLPPGILSITPNSQVTLGNFDVKAFLADGENSPLAEATLTLSDEFGNVLGTTTKALSGTRDSIILEGAEFNAELLGEGGYVIDLLAVDVSGNEVTRQVNFSITSSLFAANHSEMYIAGPFNGWGADPLVLVADNTWEISNIDLGGDPFKFKNTVDWTDTDWGDGNCDGIMEITSGGGANTECGYSGLSTITFNDQTLAYTIKPAVEFETKLSGLYLMGDFNNYEGGDYRFSLVDDNTWSLAEVPMEPGYKYRFAEMPNFMGVNYGDANNDGVAEEFSDAAAVFPEDAEPGFYSFMFNETTLEYTYEFVAPFTGVESIGIIGDATPAGWDSDTDMTDNGDGTYTIFVGLKDGFMKFRANDEWEDDWGDDEPDGVAEYKGGDIPVTAGVYKIDFNLETLEYTLEALSIGIIGSATPTGWDSDTDMTSDVDNPSILTINIDLVDGAIKFRANDDWVHDWGDNEPDGIAEYKGSDIAVSAGTYDVTFNILTGEYSLD
jgi:hypothetical protein